MGRLSHATKRQRDQGFLRGLAKHPGTLFRVGSLSASDVVSLLESHLAALDDMEKAYAQYQTCVQRERALEARVTSISGPIRSGIRAAHTTDVVKLSDFGLLPAKPTGPKTPEAMVQGAAKALATRAARHTRGKRQKEAIKG